MRSAICLAVLVAKLLGQSEPPTGAEPHFGTTVVSSSGFRGRIYHIRHWTARLPKLERKKPVGTIYTDSLNVPPQHFDAGFPGVTKRFEWFAIDYVARFWIQTAGDYHFSLLADDAANLYIDNALVIDNDGQHPPLAKEGTVFLKTGIHDMRVPYYQGPRYEVALVLKVAGPGHPKLKVFSTEEFKPPPNADWHSRSRTPTRPGMAAPLEPLLIRLPSR